LAGVSEKVKGGVVEIFSALVKLFWGEEVHCLDANKGCPRRALRASNDACLFLSEAWLVFKCGGCGR
jgi:hypothetical protein